MDSYRFRALMAYAVLMLSQEARARRRRSRARSCRTKAWLLERGCGNFLRMDEASFQELLDLVKEYIQRQDTGYRRAIPAKDRLRSTLRYLATRRTRISAQALGHFIPVTCKAIVKMLQTPIIPRALEASPSTSQSNLPANKRPQNTPEEDDPLLTEARAALLQPDDWSQAFANYVASVHRGLKADQKVFFERLMSELIFKARNGLLTADTDIDIGPVVPPPAPPSYYSSPPPTYSSTQTYPQTSFTSTPDYTPTSAYQLAPLPTSAYQPAPPLASKQPAPPPSQASIFTMLLESEEKSSDLFTQ